MKEESILSDFKEELYQTCLKQVKRKLFSVTYYQIRALCRDSRMFQFETTKILNEKI